MSLHISVGIIIVCVVVTVAGVFATSAAAAGVPTLSEPGTMHTPPAAPFSGMGSNSRRDLVGVYRFSGECYATKVDLTIPGRKLDFVWARKYRSRTGPDTAMGNGWDFSYNISIEAAGDGLVLRDGNSRLDFYHKQPDDTWQRNEFFRIISLNQDDTYTLEFPDTGTWNFNALDGSVVQGKIASIVDRNGNTIIFDYDKSGRLVTVHDSLDTEAHNRDIDIAYNGDGFIETVTDFIGRTVTYEYYQDGEDGGSAGDLKSVTSPSVIGTSTGNNFPDGKTTVYTYSKDFDDDHLNHNLLTITDPKGQTYLTNTYAPNMDPADLAFDRVLNCIYGDPGDRSDYVYVPVVPDPGNNFAVILAIVNDQVGNVEETLYDALNRPVIGREFTGRAPNADAPTTPNQNRPADPLRDDDPPMFVTRMEYNTDALATRIEHPNFNVTEYVHELELDPLAPRHSRGNIREQHRLPGVLGGDQPSINTFATFHPVLTSRRPSPTGAATSPPTRMTVAETSCMPTTESPGSSRIGNGTRSGN